MGEGDVNKYRYEKRLLYFLPLIERIQPSQMDAAHSKCVCLGLGFCDQGCSAAATSVHFSSTALIRTPCSKLHTTCHPLLAPDLKGPWTWLFPLPSSYSQPRYL